MPRAEWPLARGRPVIEVLLTGTDDDVTAPRCLLADTGAGTDFGPFELILREDDCRTYGVYTYRSARLAGAYAGWFPLHVVRVLLPALGFNEFVRAIAVPTTSPGLDGIAGFRFLNRFTYGNFGDRDQFGLEN